MLFLRLRLNACFLFLGPDSSDLVHNISFFNQIDLFVIALSFDAVSAYDSNYFLQMTKQGEQTPQQW